jgi:hypothetical protein
MDSISSALAVCVWLFAFGCLRLAGAEYIERSFKKQFFGNFLGAILYFF